MTADEAPQLGHWRVMPPALYAGLSALVVLPAVLFCAWLGWPILAVGHGLFAGVAMPLILAAMLHFVPVLTRTGGASSKSLVWIVVLQLSGAVVAGAMAGILPWFWLKMAAVGATAIWAGMGVWTFRRIRRTLGDPHPAVWWYLGAQICATSAFFSIALALNGTISFRAGRTLHSDLNTLGLVGGAAFGTWPVLLLTVLRIPPPPGFLLHFKRGIGFYTLGLFFVGVGALSSSYLFVVGALILLGCVLFGVRFGNRLIAKSPPTSLALGWACLLSFSGFGVCLFLSILNQLGQVDAITVWIGFTLFFLLPLILSALSFLLPVWFFPRTIGLQQQAKEVLAQGALIRVCILWAAGLGLVTGNTTAPGWIILSCGLLVLGVVLMFGWQVLRLLRWVCSGA